MAILEGVNSGFSTFLTAHHREEKKSSRQYLLSALQGNSSPEYGGLSRVSLRPNEHLVRQGLLLHDDGRGWHNSHAILVIVRRVQHAVPDPGENACTVDLNRSLRSPVDWIAPNRAAALVLSRPLEIKILFLDALHDVTVQQLPSL